MIRCNMRQGPHLQPHKTRHQKRELINPQPLTDRPGLGQGGRLKAGIAIGPTQQGKPDRRQSQQQQPSQPQGDRQIQHPQGRANQRPMGPGGAVANQFLVRNPNDA